MHAVLSGACSAATVPAPGGPFHAALEHSPPPRRHVPACVWRASKGPVNGLGSSASACRPLHASGHSLVPAIANWHNPAPFALPADRPHRSPAHAPPACPPACLAPGWLAGCRKERYLAYRGSLMYAGVARVCAEHRPDLTTVVEVTAYRSPAAGGRPITLNGANLTETLQACGWHACAGARPFLH